MIIPFGMKFFLPNLAFLLYSPSLYTLPIIFLTTYLFVTTLLLLSLFPIFHQNFIIFLFSALRELANLVEIAIGVYVFFLRCLAHATFDLSLTYIFNARLL